MNKKLLPERAKNSAGKEEKKRSRLQLKRIDPISCAKVY